ncbi:MAG: acyl-CoA thioesterase [Arenimonas sp.]
MARVVIRLELEVRWRDLDAFDHVNHASYLTYVEEARVRWFRALSKDWANETAAPILAAVTMNYRRPLGWPASIVVEMLTERVGTKSVTLAHRITSADDPEVVFADGSAVLVWIDGCGATLPLPDAVRSSCSA